MLEIDSAAAPIDDITRPDVPVFSRLDTSTVEPVSPEIYCRTRKNQALILRKLSDVGQGRAAAELGLHESRISRWKEDGTIERTAKFLAVLGLKVVPLNAIVTLPFED